MQSFATVLSVLFLAQASATHLRFTAFGIEGFVQPSCTPAQSSGTANPSLSFFGYRDIEVQTREKGSGLATGRRTYEPIRLFSSWPFPQAAAGQIITIQGDDFRRSERTQGEERRNADEETSDSCPFCSTNLADSLPPSRGGSVIAVKISNDGGEDAIGVDVVLSSSSIGIDFGGFDQIGMETVDVPAGGNVVVEFEHVFEGRSRQGLSVAITGVAKGGNTNVCDDHSQINAEVLLTGFNATYALPLVNSGESNVEVLTAIRCRTPDSDEFDACPGTDEGAGDVSKLSIGAGEEAVMEFEASGLGEEGMEVLLLAQETSSGEVQHAILRLVPTAPAAVLNFPALCCLESVRTRVLLEGILAGALEAFEARRFRQAGALLRAFLQRADAALCELGAAESGCLEQVLLMATDAARLIAAEAGLDLPPSEPSEPSEPSDPPAEEPVEPPQRRGVEPLPSHTQVRVVATAHFVDDWQGETAYVRPQGAAFARGDDLRRAGYFEAALLKWNTDRRCCASKVVAEDETYTTCSCTHL